MKKKRRIEKKYWDQLMRRMKQRRNSQFNQMIMKAMKNVAIKYKDPIILEMS